jgi:hypothetical protein
MELMSVDIDTQPIIVRMPKEEEVNESGVIAVIKSNNNNNNNNNSCSNGMFLCDYIKAVIIGIIIFAPLISGIAGLCIRYVPTDLDNSLLVPTQCYIGDCYIRNYTHVIFDCTNGICSYSLFTQYELTNSYYFTHNSNIYISNITDSWQIDVPTNNTGQMVDCYYNKCLVDNNTCNARNVSLIALQLETVNPNNNIIIIVVCVFSMLVTLVIVLCIFLSIR